MEDESSKSLFDVSKTKDLFNLDRSINFNHDLKKEDYLRVASSVDSSTNLNKNGDIKFQINQTSNPLNLGAAFFYYKIKLSGFTAEKDVTLENNFFPRMFENMRLQLGSSEIENINNCGEFSSMLNFIMMDKITSDVYGESIGWIPDKNTNEILNEKDKIKNESFKIRKELYNNDEKLKAEKVYHSEGRFPLNTLFGFLENYNRVVFLLPINIILNRKLNDNDIFYGVKDSKAKIQFETLELWIPELSINPRSEVSLLDRLNKDKPISVNFLNRNGATTDLTIGNTNLSWKTTLSNSRPKYILVAFKDLNISIEKNNSLFIQRSEKEGITSLRVQINNSYYPINKMEFDAKKNYQTEPYLSYVKMCKEFHKGCPQLNIRDFKNLYSIFCFDVSAQDEKLSINGCDITVHITKTNDFKAKAYCLILEEKHCQIMIKGGRMFTLEMI